MLVKNSLIFGFTTLLKGFCSFLLIAVYTRLLNPSEYGDYIIIMSIVMFVDAFVFQPLRSAVIRHISHEQRSGDMAYISNCMIIHTALSLAAVLVSFLFFRMGFIDIHAHRLMYELLGLMVVCEAFSNFAVALARMRLEYRLFVALSVLKPVLTLLAGVALIYMGWGFSGAVLGFLLGLAICCLWGGLGLRDLAKLRLSYFDPAIARDIIAFSWPLVIMYMFQSGLLAVDRFMIEGFIGGDTTGLYVAAQGVPQKLLAILAASIHLAAYPLAARALDMESRDACHAQLRTNFMLLFGLLFPSVVGMIAVTPALSNVFVGEKFRPFMNDYFAVFALLSLLGCMTQYYFILAFNLVKKNSMLLYPYAAALTINVVLGYILTQRYGVNGMVVSTVAANGFLFAAIFVLSRRIFQTPVPVMPMLQIIAASLLMAGAVRLTHIGDDMTGLAVSVMVGGMVYLAAILAFNTGDVRTMAQKKLHPYVRRLAGSYR